MLFLSRGVIIPLLERLIKQSIFYQIRIEVRISVLIGIGFILNIGYELIKVLPDLVNVAYMYLKLN